MFKAARKHRRMIKEDAVDLTVSPNGTSTAVSVRNTSTIADLQVAAWKALGKGVLRLVSPDGEILQMNQSVTESGLRDGDSLSAV